MSDDAMIEVRGATKRFRKGGEAVTVFETLDLTVASGRFVAMMGPSGSGKSTLLHAVGGIERIDGGAIRVGGRRIDDASEAALSAWRSRTVGFVFQFYNLMPVLNAADNVELPLLLTRLGRAERKRRVAEALSLMGLGHRARHRPGELSGGEQQRVAIARAIVSDPPLILCDEPTGDLDRRTSEEVLTSLQLLNRELGKTILMVTHDAAAAARADIVLHLDKGRFVEAEGTGA